MFSYLINFIKVFKENLALFLHATVRLAWIDAVTQPIKQIYTEFSLAKSDFLYQARFNGQIIYLEKILNDKYDNSLRRIFIENKGFVAFYIYRKIESKRPLFLYRKWKNTFAYQANDFTVDTDNNVYKAINSNTGLKPSVSPSNWIFHSKVNYLYRKSDFVSAYNFTVFIPVTLSANTPVIKSLVNYYKLGGKTYQVITF